MIRDWEELEKMKEHAKILCEKWYIAMRNAKTRSERAECIRNYNALRGVIKALTWAQGGHENPLS